MSDCFKFWRVAFLKKRDNVREVLRSESFFESFGHQRKAGTREGFQVGAKDGFFRVLGTQRDAVRSFGRDDAAEFASVFGCGQIVYITSFNGAIGIEDGNEECFDGFAGEGAEVGRELRLVRGPMANGAILFEQGCAFFAVTGQLKNLPVGFDDFITIGINGGEDQFGAFTNGRGLIFQELLLVSGSKLTRWDLFDFERCEQGLKPFRASEEGCENFTPERRTAGAPIGDQNIGNLFAVDSAQACERGVLQRRGELWLQKSA